MGGGIFTGAAVVDAAAVTVGASATVTGTVLMTAPPNNDGGSRSFSAKDRNTIFEGTRDAQGTPRCEYCDAPLTRTPGQPNSFEVDHGTPYSKEGPSTLNNGVGSCLVCNRVKGAQTEDEFTVYQGP